MTPAISQYRTVTTAFRDGSLGDDASLESDAAALLNPALDRVVRSLDPAGLETHAVTPAALKAAACARALAAQAIAETDIPSKLRLATAASYSAAFFGLPRSTLLYTVDQVCGMFSMTASQRRAMHQDAARLLNSYVVQLKGNPMSGVFQAGSFRDGSLGDAYRDGVLGTLMRQNDAFRDGSLGAAMFQPGAYQGGSLGASRYMQMVAANPHQFAFSKRGLRRSQLRGLGGGCGCSGVGADVPVVPDEPFYKKPAYIAGAAVALGVVLYAVTRK